jgi:peptidoglycan/xylan/chitin deacetylase (PgdA/CDA1 family)
LRVLEYLEEKKARGTFFQCGMNVARHPEIARAVRDAGHEIGNHSHSHPRLLLRTPDEIYREFGRAQEAICAETGVTPSLVRVPYGMNWYGMGAAQRKLGLLAISWTVIGHDWEWPADRIAQRVLRAAAPGGIVCLHDGRAVDPNPDISETLKALRCIVPALQEQGYEFETVSEILRP